jgi:hypothetical protein
MKAGRVVKPKTPKAPGLPAAELFQHLDQKALPWKQGTKTKPIVRELEEHVWWWRHPELRQELWIQDQMDRWPNCEVYRWLVAVLSEKQRRELQQPDAKKKAESIVRRCVDFNSEGTRENLDHWWAQEEFTAHAYEWDARVQGHYPLGAPYIWLSPVQRRDWRWKTQHGRVNLNAQPVLWEHGEPAELLSLPCWTKECRFNLWHHDGYILTEFKRYLARERERLQQPNPRQPNLNRFPLHGNWADIENIDIKTHAFGKTTSRTRERERATRRRLRAK